MRILSLLPLAAAGMALFMTTGAQAVPPCSSNPATNACNKYGFRTALCSQCKTCLGEGGTMREVMFKGKRTILCKRKIKPGNIMNRPHSGPDGPAKPAGDAMQYRR